MESNAIDTYPTFKTFLRFFHTTRTLTLFRVINPVTGTPICTIAHGTKADLDIAVRAARKAFETTWGTHMPGTVRARLLHKLADLLEAHADELAAMESLNCGKPFVRVRAREVPNPIECLRYYAGWADKIQGSTIETTEAELVYTLQEPLGVVGQIIPWNFPRK